jgi:hypothetical protein
MIVIEPGAEYRGETYISCDSHPTVGHNNGYARGAIFEGMTLAELEKFLAKHASCPAKDTDVPIGA